MCMYCIGYIAAGWLQLKLVYSLAEWLYVWRVHLLACLLFHLAPRSQDKSVLSIQIFSCVICIVTRISKPYTDAHQPVTKYGLFAIQYQTTQLHIQSVSIILIYMVSACRYMHVWVRERWKESARSRKQAPQCAIHLNMNANKLQFGGISSQLTKNDGMNELDSRVCVFASGCA